MISSTSIFQAKFGLKREIERKKEREREREGEREREREREYIYEFGWGLNLWPQCTKYFLLLL